VKRRDKFAPVGQTSTLFVGSLPHFIPHGAVALFFICSGKTYTLFLYAQSQLIPAIFANQIHAGTFVRLVLKTLKPAHLLLIPAFCLKSSCSS
jgi:hypothetical protein